MFIQYIEYIRFSFCCSLALTAVVAGGVQAGGAGMILPAYQAHGDNVAGRNFEGVNLELANFSGSNAQGASFRNAVLDYANLSLANFSQTDLSNVSFRLALIEFTDFSGAKGLTAAQLAEACLPRAALEEKIEVDGFNVRSYVMPDACRLWEHIPRG